MDPLELKEINRLLKLTSIETNLHKKGFKLIAGVDEAGRGPLAGPVVAAAVILPPDLLISSINDSKKISPKKREKLYKLIVAHALAYKVVVAETDIIYQKNILEATKLAMEFAVKNLSLEPDFVLTDYEKISINTPQENVVAGDIKSQSIAAASILAKVTRDRIMCYYADFYPHFEFQQHKGYGTKKHIEALLLYGPTPIHRKHFTRKYSGE